MSLLFNLSIIGMVLTFLVGVLVTFPGQPSDPDQFASSTADNQFDIEKVNDIAELFAGSYLSVVNDISSHQIDPDFQRADAKREELTAYGNTLAGDFDGFQEMLTEQLNQLEIPEDVPTPEPAPNP